LHLRYCSLIWRAKSIPGMSQVTDIASNWRIIMRSRPARAWVSFSDLVKEKPLPNVDTLDTQNGFGRRLRSIFLRQVAAATEEGPDSASASRSSAFYSGGTFSSLIGMHLGGHALRYFRVAGERSFRTSSARRLRDNSSISSSFTSAFDGEVSSNLCQRFLCLNLLRLEAGDSRLQNESP
jgi:hypothetical protein